MTNSHPISLIGPPGVFVSHRLGNSCLRDMPQAAALDAVLTEMRAERHEVWRGRRVERGSVVCETPDSA